MKRSLFWLRLAATCLLTMSLAFIWGRAQFNQVPDLVVSDIVVTPANLLPGQPITVQATIKNAGQGDAEGGFNVRFHLSLAPDEVAISFGAPINDLTVAIQRVSRRLKAGQATTVTFPWTVVGVPLIRLRVTVDSPLNRVNESNERNNTLEKSFFIAEDALDEWWFEAIDGRAALALTSGSPEVVVAVIDSGIDWTHPEIKGQLWDNSGEIPDNGIDDDDNGYVDDTHGWDFVDNDNNLGGTSRNLHATAVAGIIAAADDGVGTTGVAPGVRLMDLRVLDSQGFGSFDDINAAVQYAVANGADVINLSLGAPKDAANLCPPALRALCRNQLEQLLKDQQAVIDEAAAQGVVVVAAAGNKAGEVGFPARFEGAFAVGATTIDNDLAFYSNVGPEVVVTAPGGDLSEEQLKRLFQASASDFQAVVPQLATLVITPYPGQGYGWFSGTSAAAPFVSGVVALMLSVNPALTPDQIKGLLQQTAVDLGPEGEDERFGAGLVNAQRAVKAAQELKR